MIGTQFGGMQQLPYPCDGLQRQPLNFDINNPPFVLQAQTLGVVNNFLAPISGLTIMKIQENAQRNALRCFMFNEMSVNNYHNQQFANLLGSIYDFVGYLVYTDSRFGPNNVGPAAEMGIPFMLEVYCGILAERYPQFQQMIDPNTMNQLRGIMQQYRQAAQVIQQMKQQQMQQGQQSNMGFMPSAMTSPAGSMAMIHQQSQASAIPTGIFSSGGTSPAVQVETKPLASRYNGGSRYAARAQERQESQQQPAGQFTLTQPFNPRYSGAPIQDKAEMAELQESDLPFQADQVVPFSKWEPNRDQRLFPAFDPKHFYAQIRMNEDGKPIAHLIRIENADMFEYEKHAIPRGFGYTPKEVTKERLEAARRDLVALSLPAEPVVETEPEEKVVLPGINQMEDMIIENGLDAALLYHRCRIEEAIHGGQKADQVFVTEATLFETLPLAVDAQALSVRNLDKLFVAASEAFRNSTVYSLIDARITKAINDYLTYQLGLSVTIDSFFGDYKELKSYMAEQGDTVRMVWNKDQHYLVERALQVADSTILRHVLSINTDTEVVRDKLSTETTLLVEKAYLCALNFDIDLLPIEYHGKYFNRVERKTAALFYDLIEKLVSINPDAKFYLTTADGRVLEVTKGRLGPDYYLVRLVK